jgi:hypothetical protein
VNSTETVLQFIAFLAQVRAMFRQVHLLAEKDPLLRSVSTSVIPFKTEPSDYADTGVIITLALNAELTMPADSERKALGMSLLLRHSNGLWVAESEVGWTGQMVGWDPFDATEVQADSIEEVIQKVPALVERAGLKFKEEVAKLSK